MSGFDIYPATVLDNAEQLRNVLESAIRNPITKEIVAEDVEESLAAVELFRAGESQRYYAVALAAGGGALGVMGLQEPEPKMQAYATTSNPIEVINAYALAGERQKGVGTALLRHLETKATADGRTEVVVNSGPRYRWSGWPFWIRQYGKPITYDQSFYDGYGAQIWHKTLGED